MERREHLEITMSFTGHIVDGQVVLDEPAPLPDGTPVRVEQATEGPALPNPEVPTIFERYQGFIGSIDDTTLPIDGALNHDHYLYGHPKR